jgi:hypothetical protein
MTTVATVKHDKKINGWGCFAHHGVGRLYLVEGIMDGKAYKQILRSQLVPSASSYFLMMTLFFNRITIPSILQGS